MLQTRHCFWSLFGVHYCLSFAVHHFFTGSYCLQIFFNTGSFPVLNFQYLLQFSVLDQTRYQFHLSPKRMFFWFTVTYKSTWQTRWSCCFRYFSQAHFCSTGLLSPSRDRFRGGLSYVLMALRQPREAVYGNYVCRASLSRRYKAESTSANFTLSARVGKNKFKSPNPQQADMKFSHAL